MKLDRLVEKEKQSLKNVLHNLLKEVKNTKIINDLDKLALDDTVEELFRNLLERLDRKDELDLGDDSDAQTQIIV